MYALRERGLAPGPDGWPLSLRYHASLKHGYTGLLLPALIAAITIWPDRDVVGIQRTFLRADGKGKAPVTKPKMMIGRCGGGAVRQCCSWTGRHGCGRHTRSGRAG